MTREDINQSQSKPDSYNFTGRRIMLIEDDETLSELIAAQFKIYGGQLIHLTSGQGAIDKIKQVKPEVILLDILLPNKNGFEILQAIRQDPDLAKTPVIIISNLDSDQDIAQAKDLGVEDYLVKSTIVTDEIAAKVWQVINQTD